MTDSGPLLRRQRAARSPARRLFLISAALAGGGLALGAGFLGWRYYAATTFRLPAPEGSGAFGAWLTIDRSGTVTVAVPHAEMGQGVSTAIPMLVAEELDCDPSRVRAIAAPVHAAYSNPLIVLDGLGLKPQSEPLAEVAYWTLERLLRLVGAQVTGGSTSLRNTWMSAREAGASARASLIAAAAERWNVPAGRLRTLQGRVVDPVANRYLPYGELAVQAASRTPVRAPLKSRDQFRLIGRTLPRPDAKPKTDGSLRFGIDFRVAGMRFAAIRHSPSLGAKLTQAELAADAGKSQVKLVVTERFYAVVADSWWRAERAADGVQAQWEPGAMAGVSSASIHEALAEALGAEDTKVYEERGELEKALSQGKRKVSAQYRVGLAAHAAMEPLNCTIRLGAEECDVWIGTQAPRLVQRQVANASGLSIDRVRVHPLPMGGSFGRRLESDVASEALEIARALPLGTPVQLIWSREQDIRHDCFRPAAAARLQGVLGSRGELQGVEFRGAGASVLRQYARRTLGFSVPGLPDRSRVDGVVGCAYDLPHFRVSHKTVESPVPVGFWRGVGYSINTFFLESFIDECAHTAGEDPYQYRRRHLQREPGLLRVLEEAARISGWGRPVVTRRGVRGGRGIALVECYGSIACVVVEAEVEANTIRVPRVFAVVDCGTAIDRLNIRAQVSGAIVFGLSAALHGPVEVDAGSVRQSNFHQLTLPQMANSPRIQVEIIDSVSPVGGVGELGVPAVAPALANAVFAASGKRLRELPLKLG